MKINEDRIRLYYREKGTENEKYLILLHGNSEDGSNFFKQMEFFKEYYHVIAVDTRGHGRSERGTLPFRIATFADDLFCFMKEMGIGKANILGFSDGGNIALVFTLKYPEMVDRLILNGANLDTAGVKEDVQSYIEKVYRDTLNDESRKRKNELFGLMVNDPNIEVDELKNIRCKTLVIAGTDDMIKEEHTRLIAENIEDSKLVFVEGDHFIAYKNPNKYNKAVYEFLMVK